MPGHSLQELGSGGLPAEEERRVLLLERGQPAVRRRGHGPLRLRLRFVDRRQHMPGRGLAPGRRDEQLPGRAGQAQRTGQQLGGVLARGAVDAPLQGADRPRAQAGRFGQLLLSQPRPGPQLPQQPAETQRSLFRHYHSVPPQEAPATKPAPTLRAARSGRRHYPERPVSARPCLLRRAC